jgi:D-xylose transport system ATP-binding protein
MPEPWLEARAIVKRFPGVVALKGVDFDVLPGEIHALCGENGAGKSTLIKLLGGIHPHGSYEGELKIAGHAARFRHVRDAEAAGIAVITQEFALVDELSVAENIFLGREPRRGWRIDRHRLHAEAAEWLRQFGLAIAPETPVRELGTGPKQLVEIVRALSKQSRLLVLDEPTAALTTQEVTVLKTNLRRLRAAGTACIYISHRLEEVMELADRITILRDGATVATMASATATIPHLIRHMVGRDLTALFPPRPAPPGAGTAPLLAVRQLSVAPSAGAPARLREISFAVRPGEVLGFGGLMGAGRTELLMHLFGCWGRRLSGAVELGGEVLPAAAGPDGALAAGLALVSEDRRRFGLILGQDIGFNLSLASLRRFARARGLDASREWVANQRWVECLRIKGGTQRARVGGLSGGNQQKVVLGKMLMTGPRVVLLDEPTRGIDVGAKREIYDLINELTAAGNAVVLVSSELPELIGMSDRILMLHQGAIGGEFVRADFSPERLLAAAMGHPAAAA